MGTTINRNLPGYAYDAAITANTPSGINPYATIADLPQAVSSGTQLLTGGASWSGTGMNFDISNLTYLINGINYTSSLTAVTLSVGDPSDPRFDAIVVDEFGIVSVITGIPASNPLIPTVPSDQVLVQYILVSAGSVTPDITNEFVYRESQAGDWAGFVAGPAPTPIANFASTTPTPFQGVACLSASYATYTTSRYVGFTAPSPLNRSSYAAVSLRVYLPQALPGLDGVAQGRRPAMMVLSGGSSLGFIYLDQHGLNPNLTGTWQLVTIPLGFFNASANASTITSIRLFLVEFINTTPVYVNIAYDDIKFQTGFGPQSNIATVDVLNNGTVVGATSKINFIPSTEISVNTVVDPLTNIIDVTHINTGVVALSLLLGPSVILNQSYAGRVILLNITVTDVTIPFNLTTVIAIGSVFKVINESSSPIPILPENGSVLIYSLSSLGSVDGPYGVVTATKITPYAWLLEGDLV